jgi:hypothetical protein
VRWQFRCALVCCWLMGAFSLHAATGLIGYVYTWNGLLGGDVEVTDEANPSNRYAGRTDDDGIFRFPDLPPGQYSIRVTLARYRDSTIHSVRIEPGMLTDVGAIHLLDPCEEPGRVCAGSSGRMESAEGAGKIEMDEGCFVDLQAQAPPCFIPLPRLDPISPEVLTSGDFRFHIADDGTWLVPFKGVSFSLNPSTVTYKRGCPNATYAPGAIRIDSPPPGSRVCVHTHRGGYAELRFNEPIAPKQKTATVDFIYWIN